MMLGEIKALYQEYTEKVRQLEAESSPTDGLLGFGRKISDDRCHDLFAEQLEDMLKKFADSKPSSDEIYAVLEYICHAPAEYSEPESAYWMLNAVHGLVCGLAEGLSHDDAQRLMKQYETDIPRHKRLPVQKKLWNILKHNGNSKKSCPKVMEVEKMTEIEALRERHSVRSYQDKKIEKEKITELNKLITECNTQGNLHIQLLEDAGDTFSRIFDKFLGLNSAPSAVACIGHDDDTLDERVGYYGQKIVLLAQQLGLNTCWAGTYNPKKVEADIGNGERLAIVIALGYGTNGGKQRKSKSPEQVVRGGTDGKPDWFMKGVEAALLAPTALNQQKFEIVLNDDGKAEIIDKGGAFSKIDKGIVKYNFEVGADY